VITESWHETAGQVYVWPAVPDKVDDAGRLADHALGQKQEGEEALGRSTGQRH